MQIEERESDEQRFPKIVEAITARFDIAEKPPQRLHYFFERRCDRNPNAIALVCRNEHLSYAQLDAQANQLANYLVDQGIKLGSKVGILLERSVNTYVALLGVLKSGAAFVPLDASFPQDRITYIASDAGLDLLVTTANLDSLTSLVSCQVLALDTAADAIATQSTKRIVLGDNLDALAYIIYTSGSTGRPKGVAVNHSSICNFIAVCTPIYGVSSRDRVYQGMTIAFDFSIEEIWPTFNVGATLIVGSTDHRRLGAGLTDFLIEQSVTVLYCVPTLLATVERDVPTIHILLVGGEACPHDLVKRWSKSGRRILNTYGPTETTVTALWTELVPHKPVTIGRPLPTYSAYILDDALHQVPSGETGEICIGGIGVACGYVNLPELTATKFVPDPFAPDAKSAKLYRTGDLGRITPSGEIEYLGRIDSQVKIRGYRIELSEIEAVLMESPEVNNAVVSLVSIDETVGELAAYITLSVPITDSEELKQRLHEMLSDRLPSYMVPAYIQILDRFPMMPSGKVDRAKLPVPQKRLSTRSGAVVPPNTPLERSLAAAWQDAFKRDDISVEDNFFSELGGHSLLAARVISDLRQKPNLKHLSIADLYSYPTIRALASHIEQTATPNKSPQVLEAKPKRRIRRYSSLRVGAMGAMQVLLLYFLFAIMGAPIVWLMSELRSLPLLTLTFVSVTLLPITWLLFSLGLPIAAKWLLIGRFRPGRYPLWGWYYCRWWLVRKILTLAPLPLFAGSPLMPLYFRLLGGRTSQECYIGSAQLHLPDLIDIGDGASIGYGVEIQPFLIEDGWLYQAPIQIGANAFIGTNSVIELGAKVGQGARLLEQSLVARDQAIPERETWAGVPSKRTDDADAVLDAMAGKKTTKSSWSPALWVGFALGFVLLEALPFFMFLPGLALLGVDYVDSHDDLLWVLAGTPVAGLLFVLSACFLVAVGKWLVMPTSRTGIFPLRSHFGLRKWLVDKLMLTSLAVTNTLYATLYTLPWLRLLGAKIGARSEVSTVSHIDPGLLRLGTESFVADFATIGAARYDNSFVALGATKLGNRCFIGNAALVPSNTQLGDNSLIGVHSVPPREPVKPGTSWLGSPAIFLPRRQINTCFDDRVTFRPPAKLVACRLGMEFLRVVLPPTLMYMMIAGDILEMLWIAPRLSTAMLVAIAPILYFTSALVVTLLVVALKWLVVGRYRPRIEPLWSFFVWRSELITGLYESVAVPLLLTWFTGTPLLSVMLRWFGVRIGRRVYIETTFVTEFDLVRVEDDAIIGILTSLQTHLFEDRVMKMSTVTIGRGCTVGARSVVLYDSLMEAGSRLDALSLVMKGEKLPPNSQWRGIPARLVE